ncbi:SGNH hydrolase-type esterase domain-containing protein [Dichotomocladium elegans]|nr:SGNH hydrolase-type esterase domain-containing protein [Dichotomocladium elegans]
MSFDPKLQGFGASLANAYSRKADVVNRGFSGYNSEWGLAILKQVLPTVERQRQGKAKLVLITLLFGANDSALPFTLQHVPLERYKANLAEMVNLIQSVTSPYYNPSLRIILITPPPLNEQQWLKRCQDKGDPMNRIAADAARYAQAVRDIVQAQGGNKAIAIADFWTRLTERAGDQLADFLTDGLHLNAKGNEASSRLYPHRKREID